MQSVKSVSKNYKRNSDSQEPTRNPTPATRNQVNMILSASRPYFAPYPGFFYKVHLSDVFVILDDVQFPRRTTWISRNRIKNDQGTLWMTIPVLKKGLGLQRIKNVRICQSGNWKKKHLQSFKSAYAHAPFLGDHIDLIEHIFIEPYEYLLDVNMEIINYILKFLGVKTKIVLMSELGESGKGMQLIINICKSLGASRFLVQSSALTYYDAVQFKSAGLELTSFKTPEYIYPQMWGDHIANLSILDMMFTCGRKTRDIVLV